MAFLLKCNTTADCLEQDPLVFRDCYTNPHFSNETGICGCSVFFGWKGEDCDQISAQVIYERLTSAIFIIWGSILALLALRVIVFNIYMEGFMLKLETFISLFIFGAIVNMLAFYASHIPSYYDHTAFIVTTTPSYIFNDFEAIHVKGTYVGRGTFVLSASFLICSNFLVFFQWQRCINQLAGTLYAEGKRGASKLLKRHTVCIIGVGIFLTTFPIILLIIGEIIGALFFSVLLGMMAAPTSWFVSFRVRVLYSFHLKLRKDDLLQVQRDLVVFVSKVIAVCLTLQAICLLIYFITYTKNYDRLDPGDINTALIFTDLAGCFIFVQVTAIIWYVNSITPAAIAADDYCPQLSFLFRRWDNMNTKAIPDDDSHDYEINRKEILSSETQ